MSSQDFSLVDKIPNSIDLEKELLGTLLLNGKNFLEVSNVLTSQDFALPNHKRLFYFMEQVFLKYKTVSDSLLLDYLKSNNEIDAIGGEIYFVELTEMFAPCNPVEVTAKIIKNKSRRRKLMEKGVILLGKCKEDTSDTDEELDKLLFEMNKINSITDDVYKKFGPVCRQTISDLINKPQLGINTGYFELDAVLGGFYKKQLTVLSAETSMGKTALALNFYCSFSKQGYKVAYLTLEMTEEEISIRALQILTHFSFNKIRSMSMTSDEFKELSNAVDYYDSISSVISDKNLQIFDIKKTTRKLKQDLNIDILIVDHLHFIKNNKISENRALEVSFYTSELKMLAKELDISIILLSQINRSSAKQLDRRPELSDLKDSSSIEQDADNVIFIYREWIHNKDSDPNLTEIIVAKNRNGERNKTVHLFFEGKSMEFLNYSKPQQNYTERD